MTAPRFTTPIPAYGPAGNIFKIIGTASVFLRQLGFPQWEREAFAARVMACHSYEDACAVVQEYFPLDFGDGEP